MRKNKKISEEEYFSSLLQLSKIEQEKEKLKYLSTSGTYCAHIQLMSRFDELLIQLKRANLAIDIELDLCRKRLLVQLTGDIISCSKVLEKVDSMIEDVENTLVFLPDHLMFLKPTLAQIRYLNHQKEGNQYLISYITDLQKTEETCIKTKLRYEKTNRRK